MTRRDGVLSAVRDKIESGEGLTPEEARTLWDVFVKVNARATTAKQAAFSAARSHRRTIQEKDRAIKKYKQNIRPVREHIRADGTAKTAFADQETAEYCAQRSTVKSGEQIHAYQCSLCCRWHIGHKTKELVEP